jgi:hypothetical protein
MAAQVINPGTISVSSSPNESATAVNQMLATPLESWPLSWVVALVEYTKRLPQGSVPGNTVATMLGVTLAEVDGSPVAATTSGTKTVLSSYSPALTGTVLTGLLALAPQSITLTGLNQLLDACSRTSLGSTPAATLSEVLR